MFATTSSMIPSQSFGYHSMAVPIFVQVFSHRLNAFCLTKKERYTQGFPMVLNGKTTIHPTEYQKNRKMYVKKGDRLRVCNRCQFTFQVEPCGLQKKSAQMVCRDSEGTQYPFHIHDQQPRENLRGFKKSDPVDSKQITGKVFALDVEMVYTSRGQSVGRVTMVNDQGKTLLDHLVYQDDEVYDPVTQYSGLTVEGLKKAIMSLDLVRELILSQINEYSILVGHGLYGDLKALKIIHDRVIDTSVLFTNNGRRPSLRHLASTFLNREIQNSTTGHCSKEDAIASLELVYFAASNPHFLAPKYVHL